MATYRSAKAVTLPAGADLTGCYACAVKVNNLGQVVVGAAVGDIIIGTISEDPPSAEIGTPVSVALVGGGGVLKFKAAGAIAAGNLIVANADGKVDDVANIAALATNTTAIAVAIQSAAAEDEIIEGVAQLVSGSN